MFGRRRRVREEAGQECPLCHLKNDDGATACSRCYYDFTAPSSHQVSRLAPDESNGLFDLLTSETVGVEEEEVIETVDWTDHSFDIEEVTIDVAQYDESGSVMVSESPGFATQLVDTATIGDDSGEAVELLADDAPRHVQRFVVPEEEIEDWTETIEHRVRLVDPTTGDGDDMDLDLDDSNWHDSPTPSATATATARTIQTPLAPAAQAGHLPTPPTAASMNGAAMLSSAAALAAAQAATQPAAPNLPALPNRAAASHTVSTPAVPLTSPPTTPARVTPPPITPAPVTSAPTPSAPAPTAATAPASAAAAPGVAPSPIATDPAQANAAQAASPVAPPVTPATAPPSSAFASPPTSAAAPTHVPAHAAAHAPAHTQAHTQAHTTTDDRALPPVPALPNASAASISTGQTAGIWPWPQQQPYEDRIIAQRIRQAMEHAKQGAKEEAARILDEVGPHLGDRLRLLYPVGALMRNLGREQALRSMITTATARHPDDDVVRAAVRKLG